MSAKSNANRRKTRSSDNGGGLREDEHDDDKVKEYKPSPTNPTRNSNMRLSSGKSGQPHGDSLYTVDSAESGRTRKGLENNRSAAFVRPADIYRRMREERRKISSSGDNSMTPRQPHTAYFTPPETPVPPKIHARKISTGGPAGHRRRTSNLTANIIIGHNATPEERIRPSTSKSEQAPRRLPDIRPISNFDTSFLSMNETSDRNRVEVPQHKVISTDILHRNDQKGPLKKPEPREGGRIRQSMPGNAPSNPSSDWISGDLHHQNDEFHHSGEVPLARSDSSGPDSPASRRPSSSYPSITEKQSSVATLDGDRLQPGLRARYSWESSSSEDSAILYDGYGFGRQPQTSFWAPEGDNGFQHGIGDPVTDPITLLFVNADSTIQSKQHGHEVEPEALKRFSAGHPSLNRDAATTGQDIAVRQRAGTGKSANNQSNLAGQSLLGSRDIVRLQSSQDRIQALDRTRYRFSAIEAGDLMGATILVHPEYSGIVDQSEQSAAAKKRRVTGEKLRKRPSSRKVGASGPRKDIRRGRSKKHPTGMKKV